MTRWEYCWMHWSTGDIGYLTTDGERKEFPKQKHGAQAAAKLGREGWELVCVQPADVFHFKRPLKTTPRKTAKKVLKNT